MPRTPSPPQQELDQPMRKSLLLVAVAASVTLGSNPSAFAQGHPGSPQEQQACSRDASRLCRKDLGNDNAVQACLQANRAKLSRSCRKVFESHGM
jgi:hypothetical protein